MVHDPHAGTLTAVAQVRHPAYVLLSPDEQSRRMNGWGRALAGLAAQGTCARVQVLEVALPDNGRGITGWWDEHRRADAPDWALSEYQKLMRTCAPAASTHRTLIALSLDMRKAGRAIRDAGRGIRGAAAVLRQDIRAFEAGLRDADLQLASWLDEGSLASTLRGAFDPAGMATLDGTSLGRSLETAGPVAVEEHWNHLRHDSAYSAVLWISDWPRIDVPPSFLHGLVFQQGVRKTISITATPLTTAQAMRDIRKAKVEYVTDSAQKARIGTIADQSDAQELSDVMDRERALIAGHADLRFTGLIAVTAGTKEELDSALSQVQRAATQCGCETRLLGGQQARAFTAAALPLARSVS
jgi:Putative type VII ESX secretion system translocon, EccE